MTTETTITTEPEQAADLAALQAAAAGSEAGQLEAGPEESPRLDLAQEITGLASVAVATLGPVFPSLKTIYTPEVTQAAAAAIAAVCEKHGWMQGGMMGKWGEEIACLAIIGPLAWQTSQGIKADLAAREKDKPTKPEALTGPGPDLTAPVPGAPVAQKTVTFA
jgi:hypothetical protein